MKKILFTILFGLAVFTQSNCMFLETQSHKPKKGRMVRLNDYQGQGSRYQQTNKNYDKNFKVYKDPYNNESHSFLYDCYVKNHKGIEKVINPETIPYINQNLRKTLSLLKQKIQELLLYTDTHKKIKSINHLEANFNIPKFVKKIINFIDNPENQLSNFKKKLDEFHLKSMLCIENEKKLSNEEDLELLYEYYNENVNNLEQDMQTWLRKKERHLINKITKSQTNINDLLVKINSLDEMEIDNPNDENENVGSENEEEKTV